jgi:hypothetical protein
VLYHEPSRKLLTASEDGLVAVHDVAGGLNQDDGFEVGVGVGVFVCVWKGGKEGGRGGGGGGEGRVGKGGRGRRLEVV